MNSTVHTSKDGKRFVEMSKPNGEFTAEEKANLKSLVPGKDYSETEAGKRLYGFKMSK